MELSRALVAVAVRSLGAIDGVLTLPQFRALVLLERTGTCSAGQLAEGVGLHTSSITRLCDRLVAADLITRQTRPDNRREVELEITAAGSELVRKVWAARGALLSQAMGSLTPTRRTCLRDALPQLLELLSGLEASASDTALA